MISGFSDDTHRFHRSIKHRRLHSFEEAGGDCRISGVANSQSKCLFQRSDAERELLRRVGHAIRFARIDATARGITHTAISGIEV